MRRSLDDESGAVEAVRYEEVYAGLPLLHATPRS
jgi:hypothetical protein